MRMVWKEGPEDDGNGRGTEVPMRPSDRRLTHRFNISIALFIREWKALTPEREFESVNVSEGGVYFETDKPLREGTMVHIRLEMPKEVTGNTTVQWDCIGKLARVRPIPSTGVSSGIGVRFDYYEVLRAIHPLLPDVFSTVP